MTSCGPSRNYFYWEPHCYDIPVCWTMRSVFDTLDGIDILTADIQAVVPDLQRLDTLLPQMVALDAGEHPRHGEHAELHADHVSDPEGHAGSGLGHAGQRHGDGGGVRRRAATTTRSTCRRRPSRTRTSSAGWRTSSHPTESRCGSSSVTRATRPPRGHRARRPDQAGRQGSHQGHPAGGFQDLPGRHRGHLQGHARRRAVGSADRRNCRRCTDFRDHAADHPRRWWRRR